MQTRRSLFSALCLLTSALCPLAISQQVEQPAIATGGTTSVSSAPAIIATGTASGGNDEVVQLSPFTVTGSRDQGYAAMDTTSGSRIRTALRDTPASIDAFTEEFLNDIGASTVEDMLAYGANIEAEYQDTQNGFGSVNTRSPGNQDNNFRIRGLSMTTAIDYTPASYPIDRYNTDRVEIASGPNSILFGMGASGGLVNTASKRATLQRNTLRFRTTLGTWTSPAVSGIPYSRFELDYNIVLKPRVWALRLLGLYENGGNRSWQGNTFARNKRINPVMTIHPWKNTTINLSYEAGRYKDSTFYPWNAGDGLTLWNLADRPIQPFFNNANSTQNGILPPGTVQLNSGGSNASYVFVDNNTTPYDFRRAYTSVGVNNGNRLPEDISSYYYNLAGPAGVRDQKFDRGQIVLEQRLGDFNFELGYYHNKNDSSARSPEAQNLPLMGDPNAYISPFDWNGGNSPVPDPYKGRLYLEDNWWLKTVNVRNDVARLTAEYTLNLKNYGRHRLIGLLEYAGSEQYSNTLYEILVDETDRAISNVTNLAANANALTRRHYVTEGDFSTYYPGPWDTPFPETMIGSHVYHSAYASPSQNINHVKRAIYSAGLTLQSYFFSDKLVTILGIRHDTIDYDREQNSQVTDPLDPRVLTRTKVLNEWDLAGTWDPTIRYNANTYTAGAVWHATNRLSLFANTSSNRGAPDLDAATVLPYGIHPPLPEGRTREYGIIFDPLANGKITLRVTRFDTTLRHEANIHPTSSGSTDSGTLGSTNLFNIFDALYFLTPTAQTGNAPGGVWPAGTGVYTDPDTGKLRGLGPMDPAQYAVIAPSAAYPYGHPPSYTSGMTDSYSQGYEAILTANITQAFTMRFTMSYTTRDRENIMQEIVDYYNANIPVWFALADPNNNGGYKVDAAGNPTSQYAYTVNVPGYGNYSLLDYIKRQLYGADATATLGAGAGIQSGLANQMFVQSGPMGGRPLKFNLIARYQFRQGALKGFAVGGGVRYSGPNYMPNRGTLDQALTPTPENPIGLDPSAFSDTAKMTRGNSLLFYDAFLTYRCKLFGGRTTMTLQLNIRNIFNNYVVSAGRVNAATATMTRVYINAPRTYRFSATFDF